MADPDKPPPTLAEGQAAFVRVLQQGPDAFPAELFAGSTERALLGLRAHANTISHARLVALEDSFPRTRTHIGEARFNAISRAYVERPDVMGLRVTDLGRGFPDFLADQLEPADPAAVECARIEWAWLKAYHAPEAAALTLADLSTLDEAALLDLPVRLHPAVQAVPVAHAPVAALGDLFGEPLTEAPPTLVVITRPDADVLVHACDSQRAEIFHAIGKSYRMRNLFEHAFERVEEAEALPHILALIGAGVLVREAA